MRRGIMLFMLTALGLLVSVALVLAACTQATPTPADQSSSADAIDAVYSRVASLPTGEPLSPLFGDRLEDRANIARLASALDSAVSIAPTEHLSANDRGRYLTIRYRDGAELTVRQVAWCEQWSGGREFVGGGCTGEFRTLSDTWWVEGTGMVKSPALGIWWENMATFMHPIGVVTIPKTIKVGQSFSINGYFWSGVFEAPTETVGLSLVSADGHEVELGEARLGGEESGGDNFAWHGMLPQQTPGGPYWLRVASKGVSELVDILQVENVTATSQLTVPSAEGITSIPATAMPTPTPTPRPASQGIHTSEDMRAQYEGWPEEFKFAVDEDVVVLFAYPSPVIDWAGFAFIKHIPSVSSVTLGKLVSIVMADGSVVPAWPDWEETIFGERLTVWRKYNTDEGRGQLEAVLAEEELMRRILEGPPVAIPMPTPTPPSLESSPQTPMTFEEEQQAREKERQEQQGHNVPAAGPETAGSLIRIAGTDVQLPSDTYIKSIVGFVLCIEGVPCPPAPRYVLQRWSSTMTVSAPTGEIVAESIAPGEEGTFDFLREALR